MARNLMHGPTYTNSKMPRCCLTTPDPGEWKAGVDDSADMTMVNRMRDIVSRLNYRMPIWELIWVMKASINIDSRTNMGADIQRCLLSNAAHRLELLALQIEPTNMWKRKRDIIKDAWAVYRGRAAAVYLRDDKQQPHYTSKDYPL
jgi:hypothetical protein